MALTAISFISGQQNDLGCQPMVGSRLIFASVTDDNVSVATAKAFAVLDAREFIMRLNKENKRRSLDFVFCRYTRIHSTGLQHSNRDV